MKKAIFIVSLMVLTVVIAHLLGHDFIYQEARVVNSSSKVNYTYVWSVKVYEVNIFHIDLPFNKEMVINLEGIFPSELGKLQQASQSEISENLMPTRWWKLIEFGQKHVANPYFFPTQWGKLLEVKPISVG